MKKYIAEGFLIVFSVLFALFINNQSQQVATGKQKQVALESIHKELKRNSDIMESWIEKHENIKKRFQSIVTGNADSLKLKLQQSNYLDLGLITNNSSLVDAVLTKTAWESAKTTGIIAAFDFELTQTLTKAYDMQHTLLDITIMNILDFYFSFEVHDIDNLDPVMIQFLLRFNELTGQERMLSEFYKDAITQLDGKLADDN